MPEESVTAPTVWLVALSASVPPLTLREPEVLPSVPLPVSASVPPVMLVPPE